MWPFSSGGEEEEEEEEESFLVSHKVMHPEERTMLMKTRVSRWAPSRDRQEPVESAEASFRTDALVLNELSVAQFGYLSHC